MADLRVTAAALTHVAGEFGTVAEELRAGLGGLDTEVAELLGASWSGGAASSYGAVWREWHEGASKILHGLTAMSTLLTQAAARYDHTDTVSAAGVDGAGL